MIDRAVKNADFPSPSASAPSTASQPRSEPRRIRPDVESRIARQSAGEGGDQFTGRPTIYNRSRYARNGDKAWHADALALRVGLGNAESIIWHSLDRLDTFHIAGFHSIDVPLSDWNSRSCRNARSPAYRATSPPATRTPPDRQHRDRSELCRDRYRTTITMGRSLADSTSARTAWPGGLGKSSKTSWRTCWCASNR